MSRLLARVQEALDADADRFAPLTADSGTTPEGYHYVEAAAAADVGTERPIEADARAVPTHVENPLMMERTERQSRGDQAQLRVARPEGGRGPERETVRRLVEHQLDQVRRKQEFAQTPLHRFLVVLAAQMNTTVEHVMGPVGSQTRMPHSYRQTPIDEAQNLALQTLIQQRQQQPPGAPGGEAAAVAAGDSPSMHDDTRRWLSRPWVLGVASISDHVRGYIMAAIANLRAGSRSLAQAPDEAFWESEHMYAHFAQYVATLAAKTQVMHPRGARLARQGEVVQANLNTLFSYLCTNMRWLPEARQIVNVQQAVARGGVRWAAGSNVYRTSLGPPPAGRYFQTDSAGHLLPGASW